MIGRAQRQHLPDPSTDTTSAGALEFPVHTGESARVWEAMRESRAALIQSRRAAGAGDLMD